MAALALRAQGAVAVDAEVPEQFVTATGATQDLPVLSGPVPSTGHTAEDLAVDEGDAQREAMRATANPVAVAHESPQNASAPIRSETAQSKRTAATSVTGATPES